jgi:hypothetical protein
MLIACRKVDGALRPVDEAGEKVFARIKDSTGLAANENTSGLVLVEVKRKRNARFHRLYWALIHKIFENLDEERQLLYPSQDDLHDAIKICVGLRHRIVLPDGTQAFRAGSVAFHKMSEDEFRAFYDRVCDAVAKYFLPGVAPGQLQREVAQMIGAGW